MEIYFDIDEPFISKINADRLQAAVLATLKQIQAEGASLAVSVTDAETVQQLNRQYRGIDAPTDVLSFENTPDPDFPQMPAPDLLGHLGDIVIAYPVAEKQAQAGGHTPMDEVLLLAIHGTLHLLGLDHDTAESKARMWSVQSAVLSQLGLAHVQPTEA